ncbi:phospholipase D family protein [Shewanella donghaensis]|uniref:phospholipase D family protein n=1 Tax=Shewanella donghaensis TaxID=238836 RepID=UPI001182CC94|nr:phospholipase D family protein [Shewanella donghaensis]
MAKTNYLFLVCCVFYFFLSGCANNAQFEPLTKEYKLSPPTDSSLAQYIDSQIQLQQQVSPKVATAYNSQQQVTGVKTLADGVDAFVARLAMIEAATKSIDLQYYIYRNDETGKILSLFLYKAAERGVRVRILLDDLTTVNGDEGLLAIANHPNIDVRLFNPSFERHYRGMAFLWDFNRLNHRMHNKSLTIDNLVTVVGGRNIGAEYFSANEDVEFGDFDLLAIGAAVDQVSDQFDIYWNSEQVQSIEQLVDPNDVNFDLTSLKSKAVSFESTLATNDYVKRLENSPLLDRLKSKSLDWYWGEGLVVYDPPNKLEKPDGTVLLDDLSYFFEQAQDKLLIVSPYFVPGDNATNAFIDAVKQGKKITIITNSLAATDVLAVHAGYQQYRQKLIEGGVKIYEVKDDPSVKKSSWKGSSRTSLHAKTFIIDEKAIFVGSFNFDPRSAFINTEMGLIFHNQQLAKSILKSLDDSGFNKAYEVVFKDGELVWLDHLHNKTIYAEPGAGFWRKFFADFLSLLPIESQL